MHASRWALVNFARSLKSSFEQDWRATSLDARRSWAAWMLAAIGSIVATLYGSIALLSELNRGANQMPWETAALYAVENGPIGFASAVWLQTFGADFMLILVVLTSTAIAIRKARPLLAMTIVMSLTVMDAVVRIGWLSFARNRPEIIAQGIASPGFHSFPSGHTAKTAAVYGLLAAQWFLASRSVAERTLIVLLTVAIATAVPYGRLRMGVHWPTDVLGGCLLGGLWLVFAIAALRYEHTSR